MGAFSFGSTFIKSGIYVVAIVQARMGSARFPGKMLADLAGQPVLKWCLYRISKAQHVDAIVVATPDKRISDLVSGWGLWGYWWRGDENDVLGRLAAAAKWCNAEIVVRITGDCPLVDPAIIDQSLEALGDNDFVSTVLKRNQTGRRHPKGLEVEVLPAPLLHQLDAIVRNPVDREHVTSFLYHDLPAYKVVDLATPEPDNRIDWCVDTPSDLDRMSMIFHTLEGVADMGYKEILDGLRGAARNRDGPGSNSQDHGPDAGGQAAIRAGQGGAT